VCVQTRHGGSVRRCARLGLQWIHVHVAHAPRPIAADVGIQVGGRLFDSALEEGKKKGQGSNVEGHDTKPRTTEMHGPLALCKCNWIPASPHQTADGSFWSVHLFPLLLLAVHPYFCVHSMCQNKSGVRYPCWPLEMINRGVKVR